MRWIRRHKFLTGLLVLLSLGIGAVIVVPMLLPGILKPKIEAALAEALHAEVTIGALQVHPWRGWYQVDDVKIARGRSGGVELETVTVPGILVKAGLFDLLGDPVTITGIAVRDFNVVCSLRKVNPEESRPSSSGGGADKVPDAAGKKPPAVVVKELKVTGAITVREVDGVGAVNRTITFSNIDCTNIGTAVVPRGHVTVNLHDDLGGKIDVDIDHEGLLDGRVEGSVFADMDLVGLAPLLADVFGGIVQSGRLQCEIVVKRGDQTAGQGVARVRDLLILEPDGKTRFAGWKNLEIRLPQTSPDTREFVVDSITLLDPFVHVSRDAAGRTNIDAMMPPPAGGGSGGANASAAAGRPAASAGGESRINLRILSLQCQNATVTVEDPALGKPFTVGNLQAGVSGLSWTGAPATFTCAADLTWGSQCRLEVNGTLPPLSSPGASGGFSLRGVDAQFAAPLLETKLRGKIQRGAVDIQGTFDAAPGKAAMTASLSVRDVAVAAPDGSPVFDCQEIAADAEMRLQPRVEARVKRVEIVAPRITAARRADGSWIAMDMLPEAAAASQPGNDAPRNVPAAAAASAAAPLDWVVDSIVIKNGSVRYTDPAIPQGEAELRLPSVTAANLCSTGAGATFDVTAVLHYVQDAPIRVTGGVDSLAERRLHADITLGKLSIQQLDELAERELHLDCLAGELTCTVKAAMQGGDLTFTANATGANFDIREEDGQAKLFQCQNFTVDTRGAWGGKREIVLSRARLVKPVFHARRRADGSLSVQHLVAAGGKPVEGPVVNGGASTGDAPPAATASAAAPMFQFTELEIQQGQLRWEDQSTPAPAFYQIRDIALTVKEKPAPGETLSYQTILKATTVGEDDSGTIDMDVTGSRDAAGKISFGGVAEFLGLDMVPLSPYAEQRANVRIRHGKLFAKLDLKCVKDQLDSRARVAVRKLNVSKTGMGPVGKMFEVAADAVMFFLENSSGFATLEPHITGDIHDPDWGMKEAMNTTLAAGPERILKNAQDFLNQAHWQDVQGIAGALSTEVGALLKQWTGGITIPKLPEIPKIPELPKLPKLPNIFGSDEEAGKWIEEFRRILEGEAPPEEKPAEQDPPKEPDKR